jgi:Uma2 family endonuclease
MAGAGKGKVKVATIADLLAIPEEIRRHEIINGELTEKEAASGRHGRAQARIARCLGPYDRGPGSRDPGGWWILTEVEVKLADTQVFRPDLAGWRRERMPEVPDEVPIVIRPDWICEVLSTNKRNDLFKKKHAYHAHQVSHYWLVDPVDETLAVYRWYPDGYVEVLGAERDDRVRAEPFDAIEFRVAVLFGADDDE